MKHINLRIIFGILLLSTFTIACTKHSGDIQGNIPVSTIKFASPTIGSVYYYGDSINIKATAISTATIHGYDLIIKKAADTTVLFSTTVHDHNDTLVIDQKWKNTVAGGAELETQVTLHLDHNGYTDTKKVTFKVQ